MIVFKGTSGLRAGWRFLAFVVLVMGLNLLVGMGLEALSKTPLVSRSWFDILGPGQMIVAEIGLLVPVLVATYVMARFEHRSILDYGFSPSPRARGLYVEGCIVAVAMAGICAILMIAFGGMQIHGLGLSGAQWLVFPVGWLVAMLLVGFTEEAMFRGYGLFALARGMGFWPSAVVLTLLFGAAHLGKQGENAVDIGSILFIGFTICVSLWRTGSLWFAAGFHFAFDFMQFFVIGTRNGSQTPQGTLLNVSFSGPAWVNGGPLGTEASYFIFPLTVALLAYILWRYRSSGASQRLNGVS